MLLGNMCPVDIPLKSNLQDFGVCVVVTAFLDQGPWLFASFTFDLIQLSGRSDVPRNAGLHRWFLLDQVSDSKEHAT